MPRFSDRTIAVVRRNVSEMLTETCTLQRRTGATGLMGEPLDTFENVATNVACRVIRARVPSQSTTQPVGSQEAMVDLYRMEFPYDTTLEVQLRAVMGDGRIYDLVSVEDDLTDKAFAGAVVKRVRT